MGPAGLVLKCYSIRVSSQITTLLEQALQVRREALQTHKKDGFEHARRILLSAEELCRNSGNHADLARTLQALGQIQRDLGHTRIALPLYEDAIAIYRSESDALALAHAIRHAGDIQRNLGELEAAESQYREALAIYRDHQETEALDLANAIRGLAILTFDAGKDEEAKMLWREALDLYASVNVQAGVNESSRRLALLASR